MLVKDFLDVANYNTRYSIIEKKGLKQVASGNAYTSGLKIRKNFSELENKKVCGINISRDNVSLIIE